MGSEFLAAADTDLLSDEFFDRVPNIVFLNVANRLNDATLLTFLVPKSDYWRVLH